MVILAYLLLIASVAQAGPRDGLLQKVQACGGCVVLSGSKCATPCKWSGQKLVEAIRLGDADAVRQILTFKGIDLNQPLPRVKVDPVSLALRFGHYSVVRALTLEVDQAPVVAMKRLALENQLLKEIDDAVHEYPIFRGRQLKAIDRIELELAGKIDSKQK